MKKIYFLLAFTLICSYASSQTLLIYGGKNHKTYLGCMNCGKYENSSIWNAYGDNGSKYNANSIWNKYGNYGGQYSQDSPFNQYASNPPILVDSEGNFYGYFTANKYHEKRATSKLALFLVQYWEKIGEDVSENYDTIFK